MEKGYINRFRSFEKCLRILGESIGKDPMAQFVLAATVQNYNLTFDLSWKLMKDVILSEYGITDFATGSPKETLRIAASVGLIKDDMWIQMLTVRNNLIHDYDGALAEKYFSNITTEYYRLFEAFRDSVKVVIERNI